MRMNRISLTGLPGSSGRLLATLRFTRVPTTVRNAKKIVRVGCSIMALLSNGLVATNCHWSHVARWDSPLLPNWFWKGLKKLKAVPDEEIDHVLACREALQMKALRKDDIEEFLRLARILDVTLTKKQMRALK